MLPSFDFIVYPNILLAKTVGFVRIILLYYSFVLLTPVKSVCEVVCSKGIHCTSMFKQL